VHLLSSPHEADAPALMGFSPLRLKTQTILKFNSPAQYKRRGLLHQWHHAHGCFTFGMDSDTPDIFMGGFAIDANRSPRYAIVTPFTIQAYTTALNLRDVFSQKLGTLRCPACVWPMQMVITLMTDTKKPETPLLLAMVKRYLKSASTPVWWVANMVIAFTLILHDFYN
jgi:hypothetical protein